MEKPLKDTRDLKSKLESLKNLSWDDLSYEIMKLTVEYENIKKFLKPTEIQLYQDFIDCYELEKRLRFPKKRDYTGYMQGPRPAIAEWLDVDIDGTDIDFNNNIDHSDEDFE